MGIYIGWRSATGSISSSPSVYNTLVNTWELVTTGPVKAPAGAVIARLEIRGYRDSATPAGYADNAKFSQENTFYIKYCMPDLGQHCANWCWVAAAANSIYWYSQHGYLQLIDDPANPIENDNTYITQTLFHPSRPFPLSPPDNVYRLLHEIATDCLYPGVPENTITIDNTYCHPINDVQYFFGLQEFINEQFAPQVAPLIVHEIVDNNLLSPVPPEDGINVIYRPPTLEDYQTELENCQDVLLWLDTNARHENTDNYPYRYEDTDHVVTGVAFSYDNSWILVSDPWTPGSPDNSNDLTHTLTPYDNLQVLIPNPLWVLYNGIPVQVVKLVFVSPAEAPPVTYGVDVSIAPSSQTGINGTTLTYTVTVTNTGNGSDTYNLTVSDSAIPSWGPSVLPVTLPNVPAGGNGTATLSVTVPSGAAAGAIDTIIVTATSQGDPSVSDNDSCLAIAAEYSIKENMPDLGQHCENWCWAAAAANSFKWYFHNGYPKLVDDPTDNVLDENYLQLLSNPFIPGDNLLRLMNEIAVDCLYPNVAQENENTIILPMTYCHPINDNSFFYGLQKFIREQGGQFKVREIIDNGHFAGLLEPIPPENDNVVIYAPPTFDNYKSELKQCHDVLVQLNFRNYSYESSSLEALDHIVTGVAYYDGGPGNQWILVSDPWTPLPGPDHNNIENLYENRYDNLQVVNTNPLTVLYTGYTPGGPITQPIQVVKLILISPENVPTTPCTGTASIRFVGTGSWPATFLWGIGKARTTENLVVNTGDNLVVRFLKQDNVTVENDIVIWSRTAPGAQVVTLTDLVVAHDNNRGGGNPLNNVKRVKLVLTNSAGTVILDNMAWYTPVQDDWSNRISWIILKWGNHNSSEQDQLSNEISSIILNWGNCPTSRDQQDFSG
jgi:uncharacterized repeat protein (TIGR01451 family)